MAGKAMAAGFLFALALLSSGIPGANPAAALDAGMPTTGLRLPQLRAPQPRAQRFAGRLDERTAPTLLAEVCRTILKSLPGPEAEPPAIRLSGPAAARLFSAIATWSGFRPVPIGAGWASSRMPTGPPARTPRPAVFTSWPAVPAP